MPRGAFVVLEGIDGSGLTTQAESLRIWFEHNRLPVFVTKEPTRGLIGGLLDGALDHRVQFAPDVMALLFTADRMDHIATKIVPELEKGTSVICDRYFLSGLAYQSLELDLAWLRSLNSRCLIPDLTIFLDVTVEASVARSHSDVWRSSERVQLYEQESTLEKVRESFLHVIDILRSEGQKIEIVDGSDDINIIAARISAIVEQLFPAESKRPSKISQASTDISSMLRPTRT